MAKKNISTKIHEEQEQEEFWYRGTKFGKEGNSCYRFNPPDDIEDITKEQYAFWKKERENKNTCNAFEQLQLEYEEWEDND